MAVWTHNSHVLNSKLATFSCSVATNTKATKAASCTQLQQTLRVRRRIGLRPPLAGSSGIEEIANLGRRRLIEEKIEPALLARVEVKEALDFIQLDPIARSCAIDLKSYLCGKEWQQLQAWRNYVPHVRVHWH